MPRRTLHSRRRGNRAGHGEGIDHITCRLCGREFLVVGWCHLVRVHGYDPEHPVEEYKSQFGLRRARSARTLRRMRESIGAHFERLGRRWTRARVKREIMQCRLRGRSLSWPAMFRFRPDLIWATRRLFGSWEKAVRACGVSYDDLREHRSWSSGKIIEVLIGLKRRGAKLNAGAIRKRDSGLLQAAVSRWGSWSRALLAAGIDPGEARTLRRWTRSSVRDSIRSIGRTVGLREMKRLDSGLLDAAVRNFGSWKAAVLAAGLSYPRRNAPQKWPREKVLEEIRRRARLGLSVRATEIQQDFRGLGAAGQREFGTWPRAVKAAGVPYPKRGGAWKWPRDRILEVINARVARDQDVRDTFMKRTFGGLWWAARREFGTWRRAVESTGVAYPGR